MSKVKLLIQQCLSASLELPNNQPALTIGRGMVVFVCFMAQADQASVIKAAQTVCKVKLSENDEEKRVAIVDLPGDILIIPQATLGGKVKGGKSVQYHGNVDKELGARLYSTFCTQVAELVTSESRVLAGVYGARQQLSMTTNGPFSHFFEL